MYLVDTSVWIHALRPSGSPDIQARLKPLITTDRTAITEWILLELMTGLSKSQAPNEILDWFEPVVRLSFEPAWRSTAWDVAVRLRKRGMTRSAPDCLITTIAQEHRAVLLHCDRDFESMKAIVPFQTLDWTGHLVSR